MKSVFQKTLAILLVVLLIPSVAVLSFAEDAAVYEVGTEDALEAAVNAVRVNGGTIVLTASVEYHSERTSLLFQNGEVVFDLNGNELTLVNKTLYNGGCLMTVKNGTLSSRDTNYTIFANFYTDDAVTYFAEDLTVSAEYDAVWVLGGKFYSAADITADGTGIYNKGYPEKGELYPSEVYVTGGTITSTADYAVMNNDNANMYISDAVLSSDSWYITALNDLNNGTNTFVMKNTKVYAYGGGMIGSNLALTDAVELHGGNVTIEDCEIYSEYGVGILPYDTRVDKTGCDLTVIGTTIRADKPYDSNGSTCISTNHGYSKNTSALLSGCTLLAENQCLAIYWPSPGTLTIDDAAGDTYFAATDTVIEVRTGVLNVIDDPNNEYSVTFEVTEKTDVEFTPTSGESGSTVFGAAIAVSQHVLNEPLTVNISGGTYIAPYAVLEEDVYVNELHYVRSDSHPLGDVVVNVYDGKFKGAVANLNSDQYHNEYFNLYSGVFTNLPEGMTNADVPAYTLYAHTLSDSWYVFGESVYDTAELHPDTERRDDCQAKCSVAGYTGDIVCVECGKLVESGEEIPALGQDAPEDAHTGVMLIPGKDATCTEDGYTESKVCSDCGRVFVAAEIIAAPGEHTDADGNNICDVCGEEIDSDTVTGMDSFRCKMCAKYEKNKDVPVIGWFYTLVHFFVHLAHYISYLT